MFTFKQFLAALRAPGAKGAIEAAAPTQRVLSHDGGEKKLSHAESGPAENVTGFSPLTKRRRLDRWLDRVVQLSGSQAAFVFTLTGLLAWAFLGISFADAPEWAIVISDVQAIVSYIYDSLLMRQQLNSYDELIHACAALRSRSLSQEAMLRAILKSGRYKAADVSRYDVDSARPAAFTADLPAENLVGRVSTLFSRILGHIITVGLFWVGIFVWLGFGPSMGWSDEWQLYINSATSALMVLIFSFLANIRERHTAYMERCLNVVFEVDSRIELQLRAITGYAVPNPTVIVPAPKVGRIQRCIFYYADIIGTLVGIAILVVVMVVWVAIGPAMGFNANWWLLIGTYAGLVGLNDGFVLRNVQARLNGYEADAFYGVHLQDTSILVETGLPDVDEEDGEDGTAARLSRCNYRLSDRMGRICASEITVILGALFVVGLLIGSSAMKWTETGQLLCNVPPSIVESFFMMILITGHNIADAQRRTDLHNMYQRRLRLLSYVDRLEEVEVVASAAIKSSLE
ncbi:low affinity iron transporter [Sporothrix brasiliensis 5110]|uniref:Low affinity iron transporter n=1 Tax=Sporothrix brasiliensis 5110 TaxID=1398154 RepID=A0A0C2F8A5_9PEZI|nr:low affinity iron transporter [Sporothrix brasiliensis 5110]KIH87263.1 low affinity iron transporter [Sporothrix brasiliensis 5110]